MTPPPPTQPSDSSYNIYLLYLIFALTTGLTGSFIYYLVSNGLLWFKMKKLNVSPARSKSPKRPTSPRRTSKDRTKKKDPGDRDLDTPTQPESEVPATENGSCATLDFSKLKNEDVMRLMLHQLCSIADSLKRLSAQQNFTNIYTTNPCYTSTL